MDFEKIAGLPLHRQLTGLTDEQIHAIGFITIAWNGCERILETLIWAAADWDDALIGSFVTVDLPNVARVVLATNILKHKIRDDPRLLGEALDVLAFFDLNRTRRNNVVHGLPTPLRDTPKDSFYSVKTVRGLGILDERETDVSDAALTALAKDIVMTFTSLSAIVLKLHLRSQHLVFARLRAVTRWFTARLSHPST